MATELPVIRQVSSRQVYENEWLSVREDVVERPDGSQGIYSVIDRPDFAVVVAVERGGFHLVDQYRYPISARHWEFPQGCYPGRRDGDPLELAHRELTEETGLRASSMVPLGRLAAWHGASGQMCTVFLATGLIQGEPEREHEEQDMRHRWFSGAEFEAMIRSGEIRDTNTVAAYSLLRLHTQDVTGG